MTTYRWDRLALVAVLAVETFSVTAACGEHDQSAPPFAQTQWIAPPTGRDVGSPMPLFRKEFSVEAKPSKATLRVVGLGDYDPRVNGARLADTGINQPWSQYEKTLYYRDFDIGAHLQAGVNCVGVMLTWQQYQWTGDVHVLRDNFDMMRRFTDYIQTEATDGLAPGGLGDWYDYGHGQPPGPSRFTPTQLSATATWALCALNVSRAAEVLGRPDDARRYRELHARIATDFQRHFRDPATGKLRHLGSPQCANAMALCAEVVPATDRAALVAEIVADLEQRDWQQTPGDVGHVYFIRALAEAGRSDVLHRVYARDGLGSYGGILKKGLTSLPETWDAMMDGSQSLNHCMLGHVLEWYYGYVAGIRQRPGTVGWKEIVIAPHPGPLTEAEATLTIPAGRILSRWRIQDGTFHLTADVPANTAATAILPSGAAKPLRPGKNDLAEPSK